MASLNVESKTKRKNFEGVTSQGMTPLAELERLVKTCMLWENQFYQSGNETAKQIKTLIPKVSTEELTALVLETREDMNLRHVPLFMLHEMLLVPKHKKLLHLLISRTIKRPDETTELLAMWWKEGVRPLPRQLKTGLAKALPKFSEYQLAKYQNKGAIKLVDVFNLVHPKPKDKTQEKLWKKLMNGGLEAPNTWEVRLSSGEDKREVFTDLLKKNELGSLALLRNLRNMVQSGVETKLIKNALEQTSFDKVLPFQFVSAARVVPSLESDIEKAMMKSSASWEKLDGHTTLLIDVSPSMNSEISSKSEMTRFDAAAALAMLIREICPSVEIFGFASRSCAVPARHGFALRDAIKASVPSDGTLLGAAVSQMNGLQDRKRLIVFTDEESQDHVPSPKFERAYMINVAAYNHTVTTEDWVSISGFSERVVDYIRMIEG